MGCETCPDSQTMDGVFFVVYTGGPPHAQFAAMQMAVNKLADDGIVRLHTPRVQPDGSIEYEKAAPEPPVPEGYVRDERDPYVLRPVWSSCLYRMYRVQRLDDGLLKIDGLCTNPLSGQDAITPLTNAKCRLCPAGCAIGSVPTVTGRIGALTDLDGQPES